MIRIIDRLPTEEEYRRVRHLILQKSGQEGNKITDDQVAGVFAACPQLETVILSGVPDTIDRTIILLARTAANLQGINLNGCTRITDVGVQELTAKSLPLQWIHLNGVVGLTDSSVSAIAKSCFRLIELELSDLPLITPLSIRDVWTHSRKLRTLRLARCPLLTDEAFPSLPLQGGPEEIETSAQPSHKAELFQNQRASLVLRHSTENLRLLDLAHCNITDAGIEGIVRHASKIQTLILTGCEQLTDRSLESIRKLGDRLDVLIMAHVPKITDRGVVKLARSCPKLRCVDVAFCENLTDMSVFELASLSSLRRLSLICVRKITDIAIYALAEQANELERLHLSYCENISLDAIHTLLRKLERLQQLTVTGVPSFRIEGVERFSEQAPVHYNLEQRLAFRLYHGQNLGRLREFLDKEDQRRRETEEEVSENRLDLY
ncbi:hypothetical protein AMATHDRAFT_59267 [Amanita thiersii Skay4041]|uniref:F-box/LRR-repeat protein 15-like leucin rich repeat domain-containing protein n=1 Tax=Amanita thiersii Skay4041 TaxID=703135 RepID=A0A2A9NMF1_9AGAR|nr:hypothetical protein AMATHDRAFT_59267 [Amanita thiersii Skay4041]